MVFKYFWISFILVTIVNAYVMRYRSNKYIAESPELEAGYDKLLKGMIFYGNIPWVIIGIGIMTGLANSVIDFLNPRSMKPIVLIFHLSIIVLWGLSIRWLYFKKGAEFLEKHRGFIQVHGFGHRADVSASQIKSFFPIVLIGGIGGMIAMWFIEIPTSVIEM